MKQLNIRFSNPIDFYLLENLAQLDNDGKPTIYSHAQGLYVVLRGAADWEYVSWEIDAAETVNIYGDYPEFEMSRGNDRRLGSKACEIRLPCAICGQNSQVDYANFVKDAAGGTMACKKSKCEAVETALKRAAKMRRKVQIVDPSWHHDEPPQRDVYRDESGAAKCGTCGHGLDLCRCVPAF